MQIAEKAKEKVRNTSANCSLRTGIKMPLGEVKFFH